MRLKLVIAAIGAAPVILLAFSTGPPIKRTGGVDGGATCAGCHRTFAPANSDARGSVKIAGLQAYLPGVAQNLKITIAHPDAARWGFQLTARFVSGGGTKKAGTLQPADNLTKVVCDDGSLRGSPGPCRADQLEWIEHADAQRTPQGTGSYTYNVVWQPPAEENGDIEFYVAGNAADGNGTNANDRIYTATVRIPLSSSAPCTMSKAPEVSAAVNAASHAGPVAPNSMIEIYGSNLQVSGHRRQADAGDLGTGSFPTELGCIAVEIGGKRAAVTYAQETQVNAQVPSLTSSGPLPLVVIANPGRTNETRSSPVQVTIQPAAPAFFTYGTTKSIAAQFAGTADVVAESSVIAGARPAKSGDILVLYGSGFGSTEPGWNSGQITEGLARVPGTTTLTIGGQPAAISYIGLSPGSISALYQINVEVPPGLAAGNQPVVATIGGVKTQDGAYIPVQK